MIEAVNLTKQFGKFVAVQDVSLNVAQGELVALLGPNGAGKTTTVRMLSAILKPTHGYARIAGYDTVRDSQKVRHVIGVLTEFPGLYYRMTGWHYLRFFGQLQGMRTAQINHRAEELLRQFELWEARDRQVGKYSKGMKQKLTPVRAMLHDPQVLFLDEPTSAMDPHSAKLVRDAILKLRHTDRTIILCTHNLPEAELLADRIAVVRQGQIIIEGKPADLKTRLLGAPQMTLQLSQSASTVVPLLEDLVTIVDHGSDWIQYAVEQPTEVNPQLLSRLHRQKVAVVTLSERARSLEDVYLNIVQG